jgi:hypothetical protein
MAGVYRSEASGTALILSLQARQRQCLARDTRTMAVSFQALCGVPRRELYAGRWPESGEGREARHGCRGGGGATTVTRKEYWRMAEVGILGERVRVELIEGEIVEMPRSVATIEPSSTT